jgi:hypothetical protein
MLSCLVVIALDLSGGLLIGMQSSDPKTEISKAAADSCDAKIRHLETYAATSIPAANVGKRATRLSENELNSYFDLVLRPQYHPCLKSLRFKISEVRVQAFASIDFDRLEMKNAQFLTGLIRRMLSGVHSMTVMGGIISGNGKANFSLDEARFDSLTLPNLLISEIISAVGRKQTPPLDPMQPSTLPYQIQKVDLHSGFIQVYQ